MHVWLMKPEGLYDTYETADIDLEEYFDDVPDEAKVWQHRGWKSRRWPK